VANSKGEPPPVTRIQLTAAQRRRVENARVALAASAADGAGKRSVEHQAVLEYKLESLLGLINELTGGAS